MSIKIERLAKNICDEIRSEIDNMSAEEFSTFDSERLIIEEIDRQMPTSNWEYIEYLKDDTDLGFESDSGFVSISSCENIFQFVQARIYEELTNQVNSWWQQAFYDTDSLNTVDDYSDDGEALASAGFGTDEDYGYHMDL